MRLASRGVTLRAATVAALMSLVLLAAVALFVVAQRSCPPPSWAFWLTTDGPDGRKNFACVATE